MKVLRTIVDETIGMFIDDGSLALFAAILIAGVALAAKLLAMPDLLVCGTLLLGCIAILAYSAIRAARR
ncbi:hypothetical protein [Devosia sp.]|uniref:hypothetical protein n=1 Tax=Devosia sp. TaxID=1871048 RepID=UPI0032663615